MDAPRAMGSVVLASASPRRRELLERAGLAFRVAPVDVDETLEVFDDPEVAARALAARKALCAADALRAAGTAEALDALVIGADTIVAVPQAGGWRLLGKPADEADERAMLALISGARHLVVTGVCVVRARDRATFADRERTWVTMRPWTGDEIDAYVASDEWRGKAGGYAIQESADRFVTALEEGGFDNVVGLPVARTLALLERAARSR